MTAADPIVPGDSDPALERRLLGSLWDFLQRVDLRWGPDQFRSLEEQRRAGYLETVVWRARDAEPGLAFVERRPEGVRVHALWIDPVTPSRLAAFLAAIQAHAGRPVEAVTDVIPTLPPEAQGDLFVPMGYWHRAKVLMRRPKGMPISAGAPRPQIRPLVRSDLGQVAQVYAHAYSSRPGEFWVWQAHHPMADAHHNVGELVDSSGRWKPEFNATASFVWVADGVVVGAVLVEQRAGGTPYVDDLIVEPGHHRHGIGRSLLERSIVELTREGPQAVELAAVRWGAPYRLYQRIGFEEVPPPEGRFDGHWVRGADPTRPRPMLDLLPRDLG